MQKFQQHLALRHALMQVLPHFIFSSITLYYK